MVLRASKRSVQACVAFALMVLLCSIAWYSYAPTAGSSLFYSTEFSEERPEEIPNIVHYVTVKKDPGVSLHFSFQQFLSVYSAVLFLAPTTIYLHTDHNASTIASARTSGSKWTQKLLNTFPDIVKINEVTVPPTANGKPIQKVEHKSDFVRFDMLDKYGGLYIDWDVIPLRDIKAFRKSGFNSVVGRQIDGKLNTGVVMARPGSTLAQLMRHEAPLVFTGAWEAHSVKLCTAVGERIASAPYEILILDYKAMCPTSWRSESADSLFMPQTEHDNTTQIQIDDRLTDPVLRWESRAPSRGWKIDFGQTYLLHAFQSRGHDIPGFSGVTVPYIMAQNSNYGLAAWPALDHMLKHNIVTEDDFIATFEATTTPETTSSTSTTTATAQPTCLAGPRKVTGTLTSCTVECDTNISGVNSLISQEGGITSLQACIDRCDQVSGCNAVDWYREEVNGAVNQCFFLSRVEDGGKNPDTRVDSATRDCIPGLRQAADGTEFFVTCNNNIKGENNNLIRTQEDVADLQACIEVCDAAPLVNGQPSCRAVDFYRTAQPGGRAGGCYLLRTDGTGDNGPGSETADGVDSAALPCIPGPRNQDDGSVVDVTCSFNLGGGANTLAGPLQGRSSLQSCLNECSTYNTEGPGSTGTPCRAVDFYRTQQANGAIGDCYLLSGKNEASPDNGPASGIDSAVTICAHGPMATTDGQESYDVQCNTDIPGESAGTSTVLGDRLDEANLQACLDECQSYTPPSSGGPRCIAVDFYRFAGGGFPAESCFLLSAGVDPRPQRNGVDPAILRD